MNNRHLYRHKILCSFTIPFSLLVCVLFEVSCSKTPAASSSASSFTKVITHDSNINTVNSFQLSDGSYMVFGTDPQYVRPGLMVKLSSSGAVIWQKNLPSIIVRLWKVISVQGGGFAAAGFTSGTDCNINVCLFDNNGNLLSSKSNAPGYGPYKNPLDMIQLSNGNFAFTGSGSTGSDENSYIYLMITDGAFNKLYLPDYSYLLTNNIPCSVGLSESSNGTINITGYYMNRINSNNTHNTFLLRTNGNAIEKSYDTLTNSAETPGCIIPDGNNGTLIVSSTTGIAAPYRSPDWSAVWGNIGIDIMDSGGHFTSRKIYSGYPGNGIINSIKATGDGGYILCGTVNLSSDTSATSTTEMYVLKIDANLNQQWSNTYNTFNSSYGVNAFQTSDGGYLLSGYNRSFNNHYDMVIIKTDANGNEN